MRSAATVGHDRLVASVAATAIMILSACSTARTSPTAQQAATPRRPTATSRPTPSDTPLPSPTATATPGPTAIAGGSGRIILNCTDQAGRVVTGPNEGVYFYDLASGAFQMWHPEPNPERDAFRDAYLAVSPQADRILWSRTSYNYASDGSVTPSVENLITHQADGVELHLPPDPRPLFATWINEELFVFWSDSYPYLFAAALDSDRVSYSPISPPPESDRGLSIPGPRAISSDRNYAVVEYPLPGPPGGPQQFLHALALLDASSLSTAVIPSSENGEWVSWAPDSQSFVFAVYGQLYRYDLRSSSSTLLDYGAQAPQWSPSGEMIAYGFSSPSPDGSVWAIPGGILFIYPDGTTAMSVGENDWWTNEVAWSPSGEFLAYRVELGYRLQLRVLDMHSLDSRTLFDTQTTSSTSGATIRWSPDGRWLLLRSSTGRDGVTGFPIGQQYLCDLTDCTLLLPPGTDWCESADWLP